MGEWRSRETIQGIVYHRSGVIPWIKIPIVPYIRLVCSFAKRILEVAKAEKPDILHAHSPIGNALAALLVGRILGIPVVYEIRAFWEDAAVDHNTYRYNSWKYRLVKFTESFVCRKVREVAVICNGLREDLKQRGIPPGKITIVGNGVNIEDFKNGCPDEEFRKKWKIGDKKVIGFIGSFYRYEGVDLLVEAFAQMVEHRSDLVLLLVGGGNMEAELREQVRRRGIEDKVIMPGRIPHDRISGYYALIDVLAYPRNRIRLTDLVTPLKPLESMAMGKALVASDIGGHRELIRHGFNGLLFPPGDVSYLAQALETLLNDEKKRKKMETQGAAWVRKERTWARTTAPYSDIYSSVLCRE
jgi:PEP-CTERM/exosortase A-associated glycosyltransferase